MTDKISRVQLLSCLLHGSEPMTIHQIQSLLPRNVPIRSLRRWLVEEIEKGNVIRTGLKRGTRYQAKTGRSAKLDNLTFLQGKTPERQQLILKQIRDIWTHTSTALEGNTLSLGDTHFILEEGLTISGKPIREHNEVIGHAKAIELLYQMLNKSISNQDVFDLHRAVQTERIFDIDKPYGAWKVVPNGTYTVTQDNIQVYIEYAHPRHVPILMSELSAELNLWGDESIPLENAHKIYAKIHTGIAHIHPFWDGNGRIARLIANIPLLKSGLPPIVIPAEKRREYIQILAKYELAIGTLSDKTGVWPDQKLLSEFEDFCLGCYSVILDLLDAKKL